MPEAKADVFPAPRQQDRAQDDDQGAREDWQRHPLTQEDDGQARGDEGTQVIDGSGDGYTHFLNWISTVETAERRALASASICGVGDNVYSLWVICLSGDSFVMLDRIIGAKVVLSKSHSPVEL
jgi:hypothetical protein